MSPCSRKYRIITLNSAVVGKLLSQASGRMQVEEHLKVVENNFILPRGRVSLRTFKKLFLSVVMVVSNLKTRSRILILLILLILSKTQSANHHRGTEIL